MLIVIYMNYGAKKLNRINKYINKKNIYYNIYLFN